MEYIVRVELDHVFSSFGPLDKRTANQTYARLDDRLRRDYSDKEWSIELIRLSPLPLCLNSTLALIEDGTEN